MTIKTKKQAWNIVGGLSSPGKMPGYGWSISAHRCKRGAKMQSIEGSTCSRCYATKGRYSFSNVQNAQEKRLTRLNDPLWIPAMVKIIEGEEFFRWFDSGDLQSVEHLEKIVMVCEKTPKCKHWLPTREFGFVKKYLKENGEFPKNLCVRLSSDFIDQRPIREYENCCISTTSLGLWENKKDHPKAHECPVAKVKKIKSCIEANCTACWNKNVYHVNYKIH